MKKPFVIGIVGSSGSGKTYFLKSFLHHFPKEQICLVSQDDYYIPVGELSKEENKLYNFDLPATIDNDLFLKDVQALLSGNTIQKKEYLFNNPHAEPKIMTIQPAPILIIEGLFVLHFNELAELMDKTIFIEADEEVALQRRIKRDGEERGYNEDDVLYKWHEHVVPAYKEYLLPHRNHCDFIVDNSENCGTKIIEISKEISNEIKKSIALV